jgi:hypothetical protein
MREIGHKDANTLLKLAQGYWIQPEIIIRG